MGYTYNYFTAFDYLCDVMHIEACIDCSYFDKNRYECQRGFDFASVNCLALLGIQWEDVINQEHPFLRMEREFRKNFER